jgi:hypothetical protein
LSSREENSNTGRLSPAEELEKACWDGMLNEMLPGILGSFSNRKDNFIWSVIQGGGFLRICTGPTICSIENETAIDPHLHLLAVGEN